MAKSNESTRHDPPKIIKEVIVKYKHMGDQQSRMMVLTHEGDGHFVDAIVFENIAPDQTDSLIERLGVMKNGSFQKADVVGDGDNGHKKWKVEFFSAQGASPKKGHCVWIHDDECNWSENCGPERGGT